METLDDNSSVTPQTFRSSRLSEYRKESMRMWRLSRPSQFSRNQPFPTYDGAYGHVHALVVVDGHVPLTAGMAIV